MKTLPGLLIAGISIAFGAGGLAAEKPVQPLKVEVLMVAVKPSTSLTLLPKLRREKSVNGAFQELWRMIKSGEAELLGWPNVRVRTGEISSSETAEEVRFTVEEDPPHGPPVFGNPPPPPRVNPFRYSQYGWGILTPTAFDTRNTGPTLEVKALATHADGRIMLSAVARDIRLVKFHEFAGLKDLNGNVGAKVQPEFAALVFASTFSVRNGKWTLLSSFVEQKPQSRVVLFLLRAVSTPEPIR